MTTNIKERIKYANDELISKGNLDVVDEIFSKDYVAHAGEKEYSGCEFVKRFIGQLRRSLPDIQIVDIVFLAEDGNKVVWQRTSSGTHEVEMKGIPPSGKKIAWRDMVVSRFGNERIAEEWVVSELMGEMLLHVPRIST